MTSLPTSGKLDDLASCAYATSDECDTMLYLLLYFFLLPILRKTIEYQERSLFTCMCFHWSQRL